MEQRLFLNIIVRKSPTIFQLFAYINESLLVRWDALFVLDLSFQFLDGIGRLDIVHNCLAQQIFYNDLHTYFRDYYLV